MPIKVAPMMPRRLSPTITAKPHEAQDCRPCFEIAESDQRLRLRDDDFRFFERDNAEEQAYARGNCELQILRNRVDQIFSDPAERDEEKDHARTEHPGKRLLPGIAVGEDDREGKEGIESHTRRERDGVIRHKSHHQARYRRRDAGRDEHRAFVHARICQDLRVDENDVDHGEKSREPGKEFRAHVGAMGRKPEIAIQMTEHR
jgi:hypothetical protein